jgi:two-component system LytT family sensor kinase
MRISGFFKQNGIFHILFWLLFFWGWYLMRVDDFPNTAVALQVTAVKVMVLATLVYLTNYLLIPALLYSRRYVLFTVAYLTLIVSFGLIKIYLIIVLLQPYYRQLLLVFDDFKTKVYDDLLPLFLLVSTGAAVKLMVNYLVSEKKLAEISREKSENELRFLRSQVNPHFVFNTLNSIYFQIDKSNQEARETLLQFSEILRYQLYECNADRLPVEKEIAYLDDYIQLQQKRKDGNYKVNFHCSDQVSDFLIVPLLLIPLVENAFKHISHFSDRTNEIEIKAERLGKRFCFSVRNTKEEGKKSSEPDYGGIGLKNVQRRLQLLYPGLHDFQIVDTPEMYFVTLMLTIDEN